MAGSSARGGWRFITISYSPHSHPHPSLITPVALQHFQIHKRIDWLVVGDRVNDAQWLGVQREEDSVFDDFLNTPPIPLPTLICFLVPPLALRYKHTHSCLCWWWHTVSGISTRGWRFWRLLLLTFPSPPLSVFLVTPLALQHKKINKQMGLLLMLMLAMMIMMRIGWEFNERTAAFLTTSYTPLAFPYPPLFVFVTLLTRQHKQTNENALIVGCWWLC